MPAPNSWGRYDGRVDTTAVDAEVVQVFGLDPAARGR
jgi:hypothetical protein